MKKTIQISLVMGGGRDWMGGVEYIKNIIYALATLPPEVRSTFEVSLICSIQLDDVQSEVSKYVGKTYYIETALEPLTLLNLVRWIIARILFDQYNPRYDNFFSKAETAFAYPYFARRERAKSFRSAAWIPDFQHRYLTQFFSKREVRSRDRYFADIANHASIVVLSSKTAVADFNKFFSKATCKVEVLSPRVYPVPAWYAVDPLRTQRTYRLPDRFFLISNQFWQHKNHLLVFKALRILQDQGIYPTVVCTGHLIDYRNLSFLDVVLHTIDQSGIGSQIYLLGRIPRIDVISLMRRSLAVIHPSLFEGWSMVVEETRCLGKPIILSDIPVHCEQNPPHGILFKNNSVEDLAMVLADSWRSLTPGPNREHEDIARDSNLKEVQAFGYRFLEIAKG